MRSLAIGCLALLALALAHVRAPVQWYSPSTDAGKRLIRLFALPIAADERIDPWWTDSQSHVRDVRTLVTAVWDRFAHEGTR